MKNMVHRFIGVALPLFLKFDTTLTKLIQPNDVLLNVMRSFSTNNIGLVVIAKIKTVFVYPKTPFEVYFP